MSAQHTVPHRSILIALVLGAITGCAANALLAKSGARADGQTAAFTENQKATLTINGVGVGLSAGNAGDQKALIATVNKSAGKTGVLASIDPAGSATVLTSTVWTKGNFTVSASGPDAGNVASLVGTTINATPVGWLVRNVADPLGRVFLNLLIMTVIPLVFASLAVGVAKLGDLSRLGRMGARTFAYFLLTSGIAVVIGLTLVNIVQPGKGLPEATVAQMKAAYGGQADEKSKPPEFGVDTFVNMIPRNPIGAAADSNMLGVIVFALLTGVGLTRIPKHLSAAMLPVLEAIGELMVFIIGVAMRIAPYGVFALIFSNTAQFGFGLLQSLGAYVGVVLVGLGIQMFIIFPILLTVFGKTAPLAFFRKVRGVIVTAFSTSSSSATLPTSIQAAEEELNIPAPVAGFVLPLGATMNMNGTALFEGVTVLFLAQVAGFDLTLTQQLIVVGLSVITAVGAAGVPGGSIPLLAMVLLTVNVPADFIFLILGVDRLLDMCRTTVNVVGDLTAVVYVNRTEGGGLAPPVPPVAVTSPASASPSASP